MSYVTANLDVRQRVMESFFGAGGLQTPIVDVYGEYRKCKRPWGTNNPSLLGTCVTCKGLCNSLAYSVFEMIFILI